MFYNIFNKDGKCLVCGIKNKPTEKILRERNESCVTSEIQYLNPSHIAYKDGEIVFLDISQPDIPKERLLSDLKRTMEFIVLEVAPYHKQINAVLTLTSKSSSSIIGYTKDDATSVIKAVNIGITIYNDTKLKIESGLVKEIDAIELRDTFQKMLGGL